MNGGNIRNDSVMFQSIYVTYVLSDKDSFSITVNIY